MTSMWITDVFSNTINILINGQVTGNSLEYFCNEHVTFLQYKHPKNTKQIKLTQLHKLHPKDTFVFFLEQSVSA